MEIKVTKDYVTITSQELHRGEFNINPLHFTFSSDYTDNLVKKVVFTTNQSYMETIINNEATIPYEVLVQKGNVLLGVYAYEVDGEDLVLRYSPKPVYLKVEEGSWVEAVDGTTVVPALTIEQYEQAMQQALTEFNIQKQEIANEIVVLAEGSFNNYYEEKVGVFDQHVADKTAEIDQHLDEYERTWRGTNAEYEALTKDNNTQYYIEED